MTTATEKRKLTNQKNPPSSPKRHPSKFTLLSLCATIILILAPLFFFSFWIQNSHPQKLSLTNFSPTPTATQLTPTLVPIPTGKQTFYISTGRKTGPKFATITLDPYDPSIGSSQHLIASINSPKPVTQVTASLHTDSQQAPPVNLSLSSGTAYDGTWIADLSYHDTYDFVYKIIFTAIDSTGETNQFDLILR
jgi:hypothetical protein